jgi:cytochrome c oxidase subunit 2
LPLVRQPSPDHGEGFANPLEGNSMTMPRRSRTSPALVLLVAAVIAVAVFLGILALRGPDIVAQLDHVWASFFPPVATTVQGGEIRNLYDIVFGIAVVIFLLVEGLIIWTVVRYRRKPSQVELPPQTHGNNLLEITWTLIPTIIVAGLFVLSWQTLNDVDKSNVVATDVRVRALAARYQWTFEYLTADGQQVEFKQLAPELVVPAGQTIHLDLRSSDVIHAFYVPQFLFKRDVIPGKDNSFDFKVDSQFAGQSFHGQCAELCGTYHWTMQFTVKALAPAEFETWLQSQIAAAKASPSPAASAGPTTGTTLELAAKNIAYDKTSLEAPAGQPFTIKFTNEDAGVPHNVSIHQGSATGAEVFKGEIFSGVDARSYAVPALPAGTYTFVCSVHPNMTGTLTVK